ncbi:MAG: hypothetical protein ACLQPD_12530 [Desulfomonilaceae bacterium]
MNRTLKLLVVAALALVLVPHSYANELLPPDVIRMIEVPALQPDSLAPKDSPKNRGADNPADIKTSGRQGAGPLVQCSSLDEWVPLDIIRTWVIPFDP